VSIDRETGRIYVYELIPVGGTEEEPEFEERDITPADVSRIAAQAAKNVIMSSIARPSARRSTRSTRTGSVRASPARSSSPTAATRSSSSVRVSRRCCPRRAAPNERYDHNQRLKAYIIEVRKTSTEPSIVVSRTHPGLIRRLFELEVPEIYDGIVEIKSVAREPGMRSKVAVSSRESGLDPVGACVGPKGSRVRMIVSELRGERIDVIPWSEEPETTSQRDLACQGLSCSSTRRTTSRPSSSRRPALARHRQGGPERRLAAKLTGWRIDIKSQVRRPRPG
jgi:transcription termination/antitermination protein NusA